LECSNFWLSVLKPGAAARQKVLVHRFNLRMIHQR
jgi:hypothetical protein